MAPHGFAAFLRIDFVASTGGRDATRRAFVLAVAVKKSARPRRGKLRDFRSGCRRNELNCRGSLTTSPELELTVTG